MNENHRTYLYFPFTKQLSSRGSPKALTEAACAGSMLFQQHCTLISAESCSKTQAWYSPGGAISENSSALEPCFPFGLLLFIRLKWEVQAQVGEHIPIVRAQGKLSPTKIQSWDLGGAQTCCQAFDKGMHLPQNDFPQMDNPCKISGSFPQDLSCSRNFQDPAQGPSSS